MPAVERADFARSADALPCGDRVMAQDENVVISEPPRPPPDASDEPTVVDAAGRKNDDTVSSDTAVTAARSSGVTTASPLILQGEELARAIALLRLVVLAGLAGLVAVWLQPRPSPGRALATISTVITVLVSLGLLVELRDVNKEMLGQDRLAERFARISAANPGERSSFMGDKLRTILDEFCGDQLPEDDRAFVLAQRSPYEKYE